MSYKKLLQLAAVLIKPDKCNHDCSHSFTPQLLSHSRGERGKKWYYLSHAVMYLCAGVNTLRHMLIGTKISPSLFLHGSETKVGVGRTGNKAKILAHS